MKELNLRIRMFTGFIGVLLSMWVSVTVSLAQQKSGTIQGQVIGLSYEALPGASVIVKGTTIGTATNLSGKFTLNNVPLGKQVIVVSYMGFKPEEREVSVTSGSIVMSNIQLREMIGGQLETVSITGVYEGQQKALNQQRNSDNIKQVISADLMGRYPDLNVAESLQRLPGVTIARNSSGEGATVQLRGTPGHFTNINLNGEQIMGSSEEGQRNISLDVVPVNVLSSMEVIKTLTPDLDGDAIAGSINMKTPTAASMKPVISVDLGTGYNDLRSNFNAIGNIGLGQRFYADEAVPNGRLGIMATGSYFRTRNGYDEIRAQVWEENDYGQGDIYFPTDIRILYVENDRTRTGTSATIDYIFSPNSNIVANFMYSNHDNDLTRYRKRTRMQTARTTLNDEGVYENARGRGYNELRVANESNSTLNFNLEGETQIGRLKLDAGLFYNKSAFVSESGTYNFITGNIPLEIEDISTDYLMAYGTDWKNDASLYTYNTVERPWWNTSGRNYTARLNGTLPYQMGDNSAIFKFGGKFKNMHNRRSRPDNALVTTYAGDAALGNLANFAGQEEVSGSLLGNNTNFGLGVDRDRTISFLDENLGTDLFPVNERDVRYHIDAFYYDAVERISSGYIMNRIQSNRLMFLTGVRLEYNTVNYRGNIIQEDATGAWESTTRTEQSNSYLKVLPNIQFKYDLDKSSLLRAALTYGYSRPNFIDLVPGRVINILSETITDGNPELEPASATNFDLMYEKYLSNLGIISVGAFYKIIDRFQYNSVFALNGDEFNGADQYTGWRWFRTLNGNTANVTGLEFNVQTNLTFLPGILSGISVMANYTYTHSDADAQFREGLRLPGQADHTANGSLSFSYKKFLIQGNLNYNSSYTESLGDQDATDVIRDNRVQLDANASYRLNQRISFYVEGLNLTNAPQRSYFGERDRMYQKQYYSYWGRAGVKVRF